MKAQPTASPETGASRWPSTAVTTRRLRVHLPLRVGRQLGCDALHNDRLAVGAKYLDKGTLYVAHFGDDGSGTWLPLTLANVGKDGTRLGDKYKTIDEIYLINTRAARTGLRGRHAHGPPRVDGVHLNGDVYVTLAHAWPQRHHGHECAQSP